MKAPDIEQEFRFLHKEVEAAVSLTEDAKLNLLVAIDNIRIEVEVLRRFMESYHPDFADQYAPLREEVMRRVNPEWMEESRGTGKT